VPVPLAAQLLLVVSTALAGAPPAAAVGGSQPPPAVTQLRAEALRLVLRDDAASLARALELLDAAIAAAPGLVQARADRALIELLDAAARRDEAAVTEPTDAARRGWRELRERALDRLRPLVHLQPEDPAVMRALAVYYGLDGNVAHVARLVERARSSPPDPWMDFAELVAALPGTSADARVGRLGAFAATHPRLLRAGMMLARAQRELGLPEQTLATLDELLTANPDHELAGALKAQLLSAPPGRVTIVPVPQDAPPPQLPGLLPRKSSGGAAPNHASLSPERR
jgi:hypothetical protein